MVSPQDHQCLRITLGQGQWHKSLGIKCGESSVVCPQQSPELCDSLRAKRGNDLLHRFNYWIEGNTEAHRYFPLWGNHDGGWGIPDIHTDVVFKSGPSSPFASWLLSSCPSFTLFIMSQLLPKPWCCFITLWPSTPRSLCRGCSSAWNPLSSLPSSITQLRFRPS